MNSIVFNPTFCMMLFLPATLLLLYSIVNTCGQLGLTNEQIQFANLRVGTVAFVIGWFCPALVLLVVRPFVSRFMRVNIITFLMGLNILFAALCLFLVTLTAVLNFNFERAPIASSDINGKQFVAFYSEGFLGDEAVIILRKRVLCPGVFWYHRLHFEDHACDVTFAFATDNQLRCVFRKSFDRPTTKLLNY